MSQTSVNVPRTKDTGSHAEGPHADPAFRPDFATGLSNAVRDNPASAALIGMGIAWLFLGGGKVTIFGGGKPHDRQSQRNDQPRRDEPRYYDPPQASGDRRFASDDATAGSVGSTLSRAGTSLRDRADDAGAGIRDAASTLASYGSDAISSTSNGLGSASSHIGDVLSGVGSSAYDVSLATSHAVRYQADNLHQTISEFFERQPVALGVLGLAIGSGIAAALPKTDIERQYVGDASDMVKEQALSFVGGRLDDATALARNAAGEIAKEVKAQGLTKESLVEAVKGVGEQVSNVVESVKDDIAKTPS